MKLPGRLEWKILAAVSLVALAAAGVAAYGLRFALVRFAGLTHRHEEDVSQEAARAADVFGAYFSERKADFHRRAIDLAARWTGRLDGMAEVDDLLRARVREGEVVVASWDAAPDVLESARSSPPVTVPLPAVAPAGARTLELTFGIPKVMYEHFLALRDAMDREHELDRAYDAFVPQFQRQYLIAMVSLLALAPILGLAVARRTTRRLARLREAARQVGAGDLAVRLLPKGKDELDDLARAFDTMVGELAHARTRIEYMQKVSAWQEVARRLAHEIKNPLTPVQLAVQELVSKYPGDDARYKNLLGTATEILHEEITGLRRLVDDFSAFAKLSRVEPEPLDMAQVVEEFARQHPEWAAFVRVLPAGPGGTRALCDKTLFRRVLANLVENGVQAAQEAGRTPRIELSVVARPDLRRVVITVDDNGGGVEPADRQRIFDPYVTNKVGGTGLGLSIVRKIVIDHGGDVVADSAPVEIGGARFVVEIPAVS